MMNKRIEFALVLIVMLIFTTSQAAVISVPAGYASIQDAIDAAQDGDVIEVQSGIYYENVDVYRPLTLRGVGMPTVDAGWKGSAIMLSADGVTLEGFNATNSSDAGIEIISDYNIIKGNSAYGNYHGISSDKSSNNNLEGNNVSCNDYGIGLFISNNNTIKGNEATYNYRDGILLQWSDNNNLEDNRVNHNKGKGVKLCSHSNSNIMRSNQMSGNRYNFEASGLNDIDISNLVDGKPVYYLIGINDTAFDSSSDAGVIYCFECNNITITGQNLNNNSYGVRFDNTSDSSVKGNKFSYNEYGIYLDCSTNINIEDNNASYNDCGLYLWRSKNNSINANLVIYSDDNGIELYLYSNNNILKRNYVRNNNKYGISDWSDGNNTIILNNISYNHDGLILLDSDNNIVKGNEVSYNYGLGIIFTSSDNNIMRDNQMSGNRYNFKANGVNDIDISNLVDGKPVYYLVGINDTLLDSSSDAGTVYCLECNNVTIAGLSFNNNCCGIRLDDTSDSYIKENKFGYNRDGIYLDCSTNIDIEENNVSCNQNGIYLSSSSINNILKSNDVRYNENGIYDKSYGNNTIVLNNVSHNKDYGIYIIKSSNNTMEGNNVSYNDHGIYLDKSRNNVMKNNVMSNNLYNFGAEFETKADTLKMMMSSKGYDTIISQQKDQTDVESGWDNDIDISNLVEGKPIYYLANESDVILDSNSNAGAVYCIDCENITLNDLNLVNNMYGVYFFNTIDSEIENCHINNNELMGIIFSYSMNNSIYRNNVSHNQNGIGLLDSNYNSIVSNGIRFNNMGGVTFVFGSHSNTITENQIERNDGGVIFYRSSNNSIISNNVTYHNLSITISDSINNTINSNNIIYSKMGIGLSASRDSTIEENNASCNGIGIGLKASNNNIINDNNASYNELAGIELVDSNNNKIAGNKVHYNKVGGFTLSGSSNNILQANNASYSEIGIGTEESCNNTLSMNSFCYNGFVGIGLMFDSSNNDIFRNNLIGNTVVSAIDNSTNSWDDDTAGNYYSDFNCTDSDGNRICDSVYRIFGGENVDRYPLAAPST